MTEIFEEHVCNEVPGISVTDRTPTPPRGKPLSDDEMVASLEGRIGSDHLQKRLCRQGDHRFIRVCDQKKFRLHWENISFLSDPLLTFLRISGLIRKARRNALDYRLETMIVPIQDLPTAFENYRILHLSDLHLDGIEDGGARLGSILREIEADLTVISGDFSYSPAGYYEELFPLMEKLVPSILRPDGLLGILGNHDYIQIVLPLEAMGIRFLLNEAVPVVRGGVRIWIAGVDDPHRYESADLPRALSPVPENEVKILLCHTPDLAGEAARAGIDYYLCGHTHGGQICLPGGRPLIVNTSSPRHYVKGKWHHGSMKGYTSRGAGTVGVPARFNCPPEITVHRLIRQ